MNTKGPEAFLMCAMETIEDHGLCYSWLYGIYLGMNILTEVLHFMQY